MALTRLKTVIVYFSTLLALSFTVKVSAEWGLNLPEPYTPIAREILTLHNAIMIVCLVIFVVVFGAMFYSLWAHRKSKGYEAAKFSHSTTMEIVWTIIPFVILVGLAIPSTATLLHMEDTTDSELTIKVTGYQWKWEYEYLDHGFGFFSTLSTPRAQIENREEKGEHYLLEVDKPVVLPVGKKVRMLITANDVIHAWWIPEFGVKKDAIPGYISEIWMKVDEPGTYRGQCAELCGKDHGFMPIVAEVLSQSDFDKWIAENTVELSESAEPESTVVATTESTADVSAPAGEDLTTDELMARGEQVYAQCIACHGETGAGVPGAFPPITGGPIATGPVGAHIDQVLFGQPGTAMLAFGPQLDDTDIAAVVTYQRNALGNSSGDIVQPADVAARRK